LTLGLGVTGPTATAHAAGFGSDGTRAAVAGEPAPVLKATRSAVTRAPKRFRAIRRPAGVAAGDVMLAGVTVRLAAARRLKTPAGWTLVRRNGTGRRGRLTQAVFVRVAGVTEPRRYRFVFGTRTSAAGGILAYSGVDPARPVDARGGRASARARAAKLRAPALRTGLPNVRIVGFFGHAGAVKSKARAGAVERFDKASRSSNAVSSQAADMVQELPGSSASMAVKAKAMKGRGRAARPAAAIAQVVGLRPAAALPILAGTGPAALVTAPPPAGLAELPDVLPPDTEITSGPAGTTNSHDATFAFRSEAGATFTCRLDLGTWQACTSPKSYTGLAEGAHTFEVRAQDAAGNVDPVPAVRLWAITDGPVPDTIPPDTTISSGPSGLTKQSSASFAFTSSEDGSTFECRLDSGAWGACSSPKSYSALADGAHTFAVRATDEAGNVDDSPASRSWTIDTTQPATSITSGPSGTVDETSASFAFTSSESGSSFECRLDAGAWGSCTSPKAYSSLADGSHTFRVRATDAAGNTDGTAATRTWTIDTTPSDTTPPNTTITGGPSGSTTATSASFTFTSSETGSTFACRLDGGSWGACTSPKAYSGLAVGSHTFAVRATDGAGNTDASPASRTWTITGTSPGNNCMVDPSACGFPDVENVGVKPGVPLTPVSGEVTLSTRGQVYENKLVTGGITVTAPNVTIRNVKLVATDEYYGIRAFGWLHDTSGLLVEDVEIDMNGRLGIKGIAFDGYTARRVFFHNGSDCAHFGSDIVIEDSLCMSGPDANDDGWPDSTGFCNGEEHFDGLQSDGGDNIIIRHNTIRNPCSQTSAILMSTNTSGIRDVTISDNLMGGGGYTLYCNAGPDVPNERVTGNRFARTWYSKSGYWGATTGCQDADVYSGNVWDDTGENL
jgi:hypothetical protein